jgi:hypothetical protein
MMNVRALHTYLHTWSYAYLDMESPDYPDEIKTSVTFSERKRILAPRIRNIILLTLVALFVRLNYINHPSQAVKNEGEI